MKLLEDEAHMRWMKLSSMIDYASNEAFGADDIYGTRQSFATLSNAIIEVLKTFGHAEIRGLYEFYCSMAFDGKGASWVQDSEEIANPYYGARMLKCGVEKGEL